MLSILIPVYNYDVFPLIKEVHQQAINCNIEFEIIVIDDASEHITPQIKTLEAFTNTHVILLENNIGRSAIRNLLAKKARYENLLFIDAGTYPKLKTYIRDYLQCINSSITIGGMTYEETKPKKPYVLRWKYTKERENINNHIFTSANFLIKRSIINDHPFNESIRTYGYEDVLFFKTLTSKSVNVKFINNPVIHDCKEDAQTFIKKTEQSLHNLLALSNSHRELLKDSKILKLEQKLNYFLLNRILTGLFTAFSPLLISNLKSSFPSLFLFDLYKLGYFCKIKQRN